MFHLGRGDIYSPQEDHIHLVGEEVVGHQVALPDLALEFPRALQRLIALPGFLLALEDLSQPLAHQPLPKAVHSTHRLGQHLLSIATVNGRLLPKILWPICHNLFREESLILQCYRWCLG